MLTYNTLVNLEPLKGRTFQYQYHHRHL